MTQNIERYYYADGNLPQKVERYPDIEDVPTDLMHHIAQHMIVRAQCRACGATAYYADTDRNNEPECKGASCDEQIFLP